MATPDKLASNIARQLILRAYFKDPEEGSSPPRDAHEYAVENAIRVVTGMLTVERASIRKAIIDECAKIAEREFDDHPDWDRPVYSARGAGAWIGTCMRSLLVHEHKTNVPWRDKRKKRPGPEQKPLKRPIRKPKLQKERTNDNPDT